MRSRKANKSIACYYPHTEYSGGISASLNVPGDKNPMNTGVYLVLSDENGIEQSIKITRKQAATILENFRDVIQNVKEYKKR